MNGVPQKSINDQEHEVLSQRGLLLYETRFKSLLEPAHDGEYVAIHVDSEDHALGQTSGDAMRALRLRRPEGRLVLLKIGTEPEWGLAARLLAGQMVAGQQK